MKDLGHLLKPIKHVDNVTLMTCIPTSYHCIRISYDGVVSLWLLSLKALVHRLLCLLNISGLLRLVVIQMVSDLCLRPLVSNSPLLTQHNMLSFIISMDRFSHTKYVKIWSYLINHRLHNWCNKVKYFVYTQWWPVFYVLTQCNGRHVSNVFPIC